MFRSEMTRPRRVHALFHRITVGWLVLCSLCAFSHAARALDASLVAGATHSVSIHSDGTLWAAGNNEFGQLGDGTLIHRATPVQIGAATGWMAAAAGEQHTLGLQTNGTLWSWGANTYGQLGHGSTASAASPTRVGIDTDWIAVAAGAFHSAGIKSDHTLWMWGGNARGQLGDGTTEQRLEPVQVMTDVQRVAAGYQHTIALKTDGSLWAWGLNGYGQVGNGWIQDQWSPVRIGADYTWAGIAAGSFHSLAWTTDGALWAWGHNASGQLGIGNWSNQASPALVAGVTEVAAAFGGAVHSAAVRRDGTMWTWGSNNAGQLGDGTFDDHPAPIEVGHGTKWRSPAVGQQWTAALAETGLLWVWGKNQFGQLGTGTTTNQLTATLIGNDATWLRVVSRADHTLALQADGSLWAWGANQFGQLGDGSTETRSQPTAIAVGMAWQTMATGLGHSLAVRSDGTLWAWGQNGSGQLGDGSTVSRTSPVQIGTASNWQNVAAGDAHSLAIKTDGTLWAWGDGAFGQLGNGDTGTQKTPIPVGSAANWARVVAGKSHTLALKTDGSLWAWGYNAYGQLGDGTNINDAEPARVGKELWTRIAAGNHHSLAVRADGTLWAWGDNLRGQLGDQSFVIKYSPVQIGVESTWADVAAGAAHSIGRRSDGTVWAWGLNADGQLGDGSTTIQPGPTSIGAGLAWSDVGGGQRHSVGVTSDGHLYSWGAGGVGQLGMGDTWRPQPALSAPVVMTTPIFSSVVGTTYHYVFEVTDLDDEPVVRGARTLPAWLSFNSATGELTGTPQATDVGRHTVVLTASDGVLTTAYRFVVEVSGGVAADQVLSLDFNEGSGVASVDRSSTGVSASLHRADWARSFDGTALSINGPGYVSVPDQAALNFTTALTMEAWMHVAANNQTAYLLAKNVNDGVQFAYGLGLRSGALQATLRDQHYVSDFVVPRNIWVHVGAVWDGNVVRLYADGTEVYSAAASGVMPINGQPLLIGARQAGASGIADSFVGAIDRVQLWRVVRNAEEMCASAGRVWNGVQCGGAVLANSAPVAKNAAYTISMGRLLSGSVLAIDDQPDRLHFMLTGGPTKGTVALVDATTGAFIYIPRVAGTDTFTFRAADDFALSNTATITITNVAGAPDDTDGDGISDIDEAAFGLNPANAADAVQDRDQDRASNVDEVASGRDPTIPFETDAQHVLGMSFHEGVGTTAEDATVAANHGTLTGKAAWSGGMFGNALRVAANGAVVIADDASLDMTGPFTIELWIKPTLGGQTSFVVSKNTGSTSATFNYGLGFENGRLRAILSGTDAISDPIIPVNTWTHVAVTWDGAKVNLYVGGNEVLVVERTAALVPNNARLIIGARGAGTTALAQGFTGEIDQVNLWRGALSSAEVCAASGGVWSVNSCTP